MKRRRIFTARGKKMIAEETGEDGESQPTGGADEKTQNARPRKRACRRKASSSKAKATEEDETMPSDHDYVESGTDAPPRRLKEKRAKAGIQVVKGSDATDIAVAVTATKFPQQWTQIGTWTSPYRGYFSTNEDLESAIQIYTEETESRWVVCAKDKLYGASDVNIGNFKLFWRGHKEERKAAFPDFDGIPFIMIGRKTWSCHLGRDKCRAGKIKYRTKLHEESEEDGEGKRPIVRASKKLGCPALISGLHVLKFHGYPISATMSEFHRKQMLKKLRQTLMSKNSVVKAEQRYYIHVPEIDDHFHDKYSAQDSSSPQFKIDRRMVYKIAELHHAGMFRLAEVSRVLDNFRKLLYEDEEPPSKELIPELYPSLNCIHYFISHSVKVTSLLEMDLGHCHGLVSKWQEACPHDSWYYQPFASCGPIKRAKNKQDHLLVNHYPDLSQTFLFCCQNVSQRRLLQTYGKVCVLDSPQGKTLMPSYFLHVRTNTGYQIVSTIMMQFWSSQALVEALQVIKDWNPEWQPEVIMMDLYEDDIDALQELFPESQLFVSSVHRERAWLDYLNATTSDDVRHDDAIILDSMVCAGNEEELNKALIELKNSTLWSQNERFRHWMKVKWLPRIKMWSHAYLSKDVVVTVCANEGPARLQEALAYDGLENVHNRTLTELLTSLIMDELPKLYARHCEENLRMAGCIRYQYNPMLPIYIRHQPVPVRTLINENIASLQTVNITNIGGGKFVVKQENETSEHSVSFGSEAEFPSCDCRAWTARREICQHFCAVFRMEPNWHWCQLSPLYTGNMIFGLDQAVLDTPQQDMLRCGEGFELLSPKDYIPIAMDDFAAEEILVNDEYNSDDNHEGLSVGGGFHEQIDQKQNICKTLLNQLGQLTEQIQDHKSIDFMSNNLVELLNKIQGNGDSDSSPTKQKRKAASSPQKGGKKHCSESMT